MSHAAVLGQHLLDGFFDDVGTSFLNACALLHAPQTQCDGVGTLFSIAGHARRYSTLYRLKARKVRTREQSFSLFTHTSFQRALDAKDCARTTAPHLTQLQHFESARDHFFAPWACKERHMKAWHKKLKMST